jgi:hypothetical protein
MALASDSGGLVAPCSASSSRRANRTAGTTASVRKSALYIWL